jgi:hypothetical protein
MRLLCLTLAFCLALTAGDPPAKPGKSDPERDHWAFQKPAPPPPPRVRQADWVRTPVDAFILARLEKAGLNPAPPADRATLLRRVTFDLTGLPPAPAELDAFLADHRPDAYERVVERLLASPHYGERWAQHWLDVVRYAESNGYESDGNRPHAWRYRDYVIDAFHTDKPYDRFLTEQLAGDLLAKGKNPRESAALWVATGYHRAGPIHLTSGNNDRDVLRQEVLTEMTLTVSTCLGLTVGCARCHDHKFDPISQKEYYRLQAFFAATVPQELDISTPEERAEYDEQTRNLKKELAPLQKQLAELEAPYRRRIAEEKKARLEDHFRDALAVPAANRSPAQKKLAEQAQPLIKVTWDELVAALSSADRIRRAHWREQMHTIQGRKPPPPAQAWCVHDTEPVPAMHVLQRGDPKRKGARVQPGFPSVLVGTERDAEKQPLDRLALARWLTSKDHPLTARVLVNRLWQHHFGRGLVATPNDFGLNGALPSHPALLDWLACTFMSHDWSVKHVHRQMVLSSTYRQSSRVANPAAKKSDPDNRLLWKRNRQRLTAEALRDSVLAAAGTLNRKAGGPMVRVPLEPEVYDLIFTEDEPDGLWQAHPDPREHTRRSIYLFAKRNVRQPLLEAFDQPDTLTSCPVRSVSTFAPQALILLNGPFLQGQSRAFALRLLREGGADRASRVRQAYRLALGRLPRPEETRLADAFLREQTEALRDRLRARERVALPDPLPEGTDPAAAAALADFCLALLNANEFLYVF